MIVYYGARFDHVAAPARPIVGTVRDKDTGAPIPGVQITGMPNIPNSLITTPGVEATTDAQGRLPGRRPARRSRGFKLFTEAPVGQPYVNGGFICPGGRARARTVHLRHHPEARRAGARAPDQQGHGAAAPRLPSSICAFRDNPAPGRVPELQAGEPGARRSSSRMTTAGSRSRPCRAAA